MGEHSHTNRYARRATTSRARTRYRRARERELLELAWEVLNVARDSKALTLGERRHGYHRQRACPGDLVEAMQRRRAEGRFEQFLSQLSDGRTIAITVQTGGRGAVTTHHDSHRTTSVRGEDCGF
jgi:hypothetical protein